MKRLTQPGLSGRRSAGDTDQTALVHAELGQKFDRLLAGRIVTAQRAERDASSQRDHVPDHVRGAAERHALLQIGRAHV